MRVKSIDELPLHLRSQIETPTAAAPVSKYRNEPIIVDGKRFDSRLEADFYVVLNQAYTAGSVRWFVRQVPFELQGGVRYRADFVVVWRADVKDSVFDRGLSRVEVIDCKGLVTQEAINKFKQVEAGFGVKVMLAQREAGRIQVRPWR
jgi:hypothetical protein